MFNSFSLFGNKPAAKRVAPERVRPARIDTPRTPADWARARDADRKQNQVLSAQAVAWAEKLAPRVKLTTLTHRYPRVANLLALCWADVALTTAQLNALMLDNRGDRDGFPPPVATELMRLRQYHDEFRARTVRDDPAQPWARHSQATTDR